MKKALFIVLCIFLPPLLVTGCYEKIDKETEKTSSPNESILTDISTLYSAEEMIIASRSNLSQRLNVDIEEIVCVYIKPVMWPDTSLGCPKDGMEYAQVITEGYQIILEINGNIYKYHTDNHDKVILCAWAPSNEIDIPVNDTLEEDGWLNQPTNTEVTITTSSTESGDGNGTQFPSIPFNTKEITDGQPWRAVD
jgi:hypothetical protein